MSTFSKNLMFNSIEYQNINIDHFHKPVFITIYTSSSFIFSWGKRAAHNRAQIVYYMAENLELRRNEVATRIMEMTDQSLEESLHEVDLSIQRLFYWGAYADKYGGQVQVSEDLSHSILLT